MPNIPCKIYICYHITDKKTKPLHICALSTGYQMWSEILCSYVHHTWTHIYHDAKMLSTPSIYTMSKKRLWKHVTHTKFQPAVYFCQCYSLSSKISYDWWSRDTAHAQSQIAMVRYVQPKGHHMILQVSLKLQNQSTSNFSGQYLDNESVSCDAVLWRHNKSKMADRSHFRSSYHHLSEKSSDSDEIWYTTADIEPDDSHVTKN